MSDLVKMLLTDETQKGLLNEKRYVLEKEQKRCFSIRSYYL